MAKTKYLDDPKALSKPLTPRRLRREEKAAARTKFGPATAAVKGQQRASHQQQRNITNWYGQFKADLADSYAKTAASYADAANTISGARDSAAATDQGRQKQLADEALSSASQRGAKVDLDVSARAAQASSANTISANRDLAQVASTGAAQKAYVAGKRPVAGAQAIVAHQQESGRRRTIDQSLATLKGQKADFKLEYRANARKDAFNNEIATQAGLIKQQTADATTKNAQTNRIKAGETARHNAVAEAQKDYANATGRKRANALGKLNKANRDLIAYQLKHHVGPAAPKPKKTDAEKLAEKRDKAQQQHGTGPYAQAKPKGAGTPSSREGARGKYEYALARLAATKKLNKGKSSSQLVSDLVAEHVPRDIARAAVEHGLYGHVSEKTRRHVKRRHGITLGSKPGRGTH